MPLRNLARVLTVHCAKLSMSYARHPYKVTTLSAENRLAIEVKLSYIYYVRFINVKQLSINTGWY